MSSCRRCTRQSNMNTNREARTQKGERTGAAGCSRFSVLSSGFVFRFGARLVTYSCNVELPPLHAPVEHEHEPRSENAEGGTHWCRWMFTLLGALFWVRVQVRGSLSHV